MAEIYKDFLTQFNVPSTQLKMEPKRTIRVHAPAFQCTAAYPMDKMADSHRGSKYGYWDILSDVVGFKGVNACFV